MRYLLNFELFSRNNVKFIRINNKEILSKKFNDFNLSTLDNDLIQIIQHSNEIEELSYFNTLNGRNDKFPKPSNFFGFIEIETYYGSYYKQDLVWNERISFEEPESYGWLLKKVGLLLQKMALEMEANHDVTRIFHIEIRISIVTKKKFKTPFSELVKTGDDDGVPYTD
jgi:hypothetical protein